MHSSSSSTSVDSSYIRRTVSCAGWSFEVEGVLNTRVYPQIPSSVARASGVASFRNCLMFNRNGPKYSTFRLIQGVGSAIFTFFFLSSSSSVVVFLGPPPPAELWVVLLPDLIEAAINRFLSLSLSVCLCVCPCVSRSTEGGGFPQRRREARRIILYRTSAALFFSGWKTKGRKALASKTQLRLTKTQNSAIHKDRISIFNLLLSLQIEGKRESSQGV
mmetsp:Transcript_1613/g.5068  ORF Transcript_1613/g.5068 Transcript_1613/m.5068 type:complete len:218 (+) Transcript_1613:2759-3412(+)